MLLVFDGLSVDTTDFLAFFPESDGLTSQFDGPEGGRGVLFLFRFDDLHQLGNQIFGLDLRLVSSLRVPLGDLFDNQRMIHHLGRKAEDRSG